MGSLFLNSLFLTKRKATRETFSKVANALEANIIINLVFYGLIPNCHKLKVSFRENQQFINCITKSYAELQKSPTEIY